MNDYVNPSCFSPVNVHLACILCKSIKISQPKQDFPGEKEIYLNCIYFDILNVF